MDFDLMDGLFDDGCWLETTTSFNFWQQAPSPNASDFSSFHFPSASANNTSDLEPNFQQKDFQEETESLNSSGNMSWIYPQFDECSGSEDLMWDSTAASTQSASFLFEGNKLDTRLWLAPSVDPNPATSVKNRLMQAFEYLRRSTRDDFLIQIWVPVKRDGKNVLSTHNQPFSLDPKSKSLECYRNVSHSYHFATEEDCNELLGLPGRVFSKKWPEWTPDVRLLSREEYLRIDYARQYNVRGSLALPVFERGSGVCLGVVEIVTTGTDVNFLPEVDDVCKALEAVDLRSIENFYPPKVKDCAESYRAELAEIKEMVKFICDTHNLPLAQTWAPCNQQDTDQCTYDEELDCLAIVTSASYVHNDQVLGYHEACCKHQLLRGSKGVVGGALMTNQPFFTTDISALNETEYPLAYHAKISRLQGAVAVCLRSIYTDTMYFIIELFLPLGCIASEAQKQIVSLILSQIQQSLCTLRFVSDQELAAETLLPVREKVDPLRSRLVEENKDKLSSSSSSEEATQDGPSWIAQMMEAQQIGKGIPVYLGNQKEEFEEEFKVESEWNSGDLYQGIRPSVHQELVQNGSRRSAKGGGALSSVKRQRSIGVKKEGEHRRMKAERTIGLDVLRQYFAGSLKDAAASIGVCPTTLKRICRQHGISRWPSRKIKKVGHSLKKLQLVIDSVQGNQGAIQLSSFYTNFPELSSPNITGTSSLSTLNMDSNLKQPQTQHRGSLMSPATAASKSTSSCSPSSSSSYCCSTEAKEMNVKSNVSSTGHVSPEAGMLKRALSDAKLHDSGQEDSKFLVRSHSNKLFRDVPPVGSLLALQKDNNNQAIQNGITFRVKATFGVEKFRFSMQQNWTFADLQAEISRCFKIDIDDINKVDLRYLDEESEWILLTCNDDLEECMDIHRSYKARTIKLSLDTCGPS